MTRMTTVAYIVGLSLFLISPCRASGTPDNGSAAAAGVALKGKVVCIDPGHGGTARSDSFRVGPSGEREEWVNLRVGLYLKAMLESAGATVIMTRMSDTAVGLKERGLMAIEHKADLFLSIHHNATADSLADYPIVYFHANASENCASVELGKCLIRSLEKTLFKDTTGFTLASDHTIFPESGASVLRNSYGIPGVLAEASFFTNGDEERRLKDSSYNRLEARAYCDAVVEYFSHPTLTIREKFSLVKVPPFRALQEAERMSDTAKCWYEYYLKGKEKFKEGSAAAMSEAYRYFMASARGCPDSYVARDCHAYLALITAASDPVFSEDEKHRVNEYYVPCEGDR